MVKRRSQTDSNTVRGSESRRFRALAVFCQGVVGGIGSPMFELKQYAWKRGYRCEMAKIDSGIEDDHSSNRAQAIGAAHFQFRRSGGLGRS